MSRQGKARRNSILALIDKHSELLDDDDRASLKVIQSKLDRALHERAVSDQLDRDQVSGIKQFGASAGVKR